MAPAASPCGDTVFRECSPCPCRAWPSTPSGMMLSPSMTMSPRAEDLQTGDGLEQLGLAVAFDADQADDLAGTHSEGDVVADHRRASSLSSRSLFTASATLPSCGLRSTRSATSRPTIMVARLCSVTSPVDHLADGLAAAHDSDAVGDLQHLRQLVGDEDDGAPLLDQRADRRRTARSPPAARARRSARRGSGCARRGRAP